jgi:hypothetical protein
MTWRWPATEHNMIVPWYVVLWRLPWFIAYHILRVLLCVAAFMLWARRGAVRTWQDTE